MIFRQKLKKKKCTSQWKPVVFERLLRCFDEGCVAFCRRFLYFGIVQHSGWKSDPPAAVKKKCLAACQAVEQVRLPSLLFSVFIVRGLGSAVFKKARQLSSWSVCSGNLWWRKYWSPSWGGEKLSFYAKNCFDLAEDNTSGKKTAHIF